MPSRRSNRHCRIVNFCFRLICHPCISMFGCRLNFVSQTEVELHWIAMYAVETWGWVDERKSAFVVEFIFYVIIQSTKNFALLADSQWWIDGNDSFLFIYKFYLTLSYNENKSEMWWCTNIISNTPSLSFNMSHLIFARLLMH